MNYLNIPTGKKAPEIINVIIEIPRGSKNKFELNKEFDIIKLDRVQPTTMAQPCDYGLVPQTLSKDGDPLDALVVIDEPLYPGVLAASRVIGYLKMTDDNEQDEKLICVPADDKHYDHVKNLTDLGEHFQNKIKHYFEHYKDLQDKKVTIDGWGTKEEAYEIIKQAQARYSEK